jgi:hypothetical protein
MRTHIDLTDPDGRASVTPMRGTIAFNVDRNIHLDRVPSVCRLEDPPPATAYRLIVQPPQLCQKVRRARLQQNVSADVGCPP